jgi:hypothetical protein
MPLYTYIASYQGSTHAEQGRYSNFKGFASGALAKIPEAALPALTPALRTEMGHQAHRCTWTEIPNRSNLWRTSFDVGGSEFSVYAILTKD